ncbi:MAG: hypothetical protein AAGF76_10015 [Pseudomonadota bacterium]
MAKGTRCKQFLFSLALNPPKAASADIATFETAIDRIEAKLGLTGQPRVIVFHEKDGRRHAHAVWSRIDPVRMRAINLPHFKLKLRDVSRALYLEHGWKMPRGLINSAAKHPANVTLAEWQATKWRGRNAIDQKRLIQECWAVSDTTASFAQALAERGYRLAQGNRRAFVVVAHDAEVVAVSKATGKRVAEIRARLGDPEALPTVGEAMADHARDLRGNFGRIAREARTGLSRDRARLDAERDVMVRQHRIDRAALERGQAARSDIGRPRPRR